jgi:glycosyltransferase involved in cell wall biosynthesis
MQPVQRSIAWFKSNAHTYRYIVYHMGNSLFHEAALSLIDEHPGTVVLHDVVLSDLLWYLQRTARRPHAWVRALYEGHGWASLVDVRNRGIEAAVRTWPASPGVLQSAQGIVLTSARALRWWAHLMGRPSVLPDVPATVIPLPQPLIGCGSEAKADARRRLGLSPQERVICSFGAVDPSKLHHRLAQAWPALQARWAAQGVAAQLVFIGACADPAYAQALRFHGVRLEGHAEDERYELWLKAADAAVQLRSQSRGESSGAVLQAMAAGLPCIVNAHGTLADLPAGTVHHLPDAFEEESLREALDQLWSHPVRPSARARSLSDAARQYVDREHNPAHIAALQLKAIQWFAVHGRHSRQPQLLVDITAVVQHDLGTGVQRVTHNVLRVLLQCGVNGYRVEPVYLNQGRYWHARRYTGNWLGIAQPVLEGVPEDGPVTVLQGDAFLGLDLVTDAVHQHQEVFEAWRAQGVRIAFMVHDLLPLEQPHWFPAEAITHFRGWWQTVSTVSHVLLCNSESTAQSVRKALSSSGQSPWPEVVACGLGAQLPQASAATPSGDSMQQNSTLPPHHQALVQHLLGLPQPPFLMVGTVEPRKGHDTVLCAFEDRWARGHDDTLVIVGKAGWMVDSLIHRLRRHPEYARRLYWVEDAGDDLLERLYSLARVLIMASHAEGFGLPLVEALQMGLPVLARRLPVFLEIGGSALQTWEGPHTDLQADVAALLESLEHFTQSMPNSGPHRLGPPRQLDTWSDVVRRMLRVLVGPDSSLADGPECIAQPQPEFSAEPQCSAC